MTLAEHQFDLILVAAALVLEQNDLPRPIDLETELTEAGITPARIEEARQLQTFSALVQAVIEGQEDELDLGDLQPRIAEIIEIVRDLTTA